MALDEQLMRRAICLARSGSGWTNPNPLVGAVIVREGRVLGEGCHERYGEPHAERNALGDCRRRGEDPAGGTLYVTLEPCNHTGKQPPCTDALLSAGIVRVVVGSRDPNPLVAGKGNARLRTAGVEVVEDFLRGECDQLNPVFFHYITTGMPYVVAKWAMTLDGRIATSAGDARWVSGEESRADTHELRHRLAAIMVGVGTVLSDDPALTCRRAGGDAASNPLRVVCDSHLRTPASSQLVETAREVPTLIACAEPLDGRDMAGKAAALAAADVEVKSLPGPDGEVDLPALLRELGRRQVDSVLVEGGAGLHAGMFGAGLLDEVVVYLAPKVVGGSSAKGPVGGMGVARMADALELKPYDVRRLGGDLRISCLPRGAVGIGVAVQTCWAQEAI